MADILSFRGARSKKDDLDFRSLNELLNQVSLIAYDEMGLTQEKLSVIDHKGLEKLFEQKIGRQILENNLISSDMFLCGMYVSRLLCDLAKRQPATWWAVDYARSKDPEMLQQGGDLCFIIYGLFPESVKKRLVNLNYYQIAGTSFYYRFYETTRKPIGYYMSRQFTAIAQIAQNCLRNF